MKIERTKNAVRNIFFGIVLKIFAVIIPFIVKRLIVNTIGIEYIGVDSLFASVLNVLNLTELGVGTAMVYFMYKPIAENDYARLNALLNLYKKYYRNIGLAILCIGLFIIPAVPYLAKQDVPDGINIYILYLISLTNTVLSYWLFSYKSSLLQAFQRADLISKIHIISLIVRYLLQTIAIALFRNYYFYSIVLIIAQLIVNILIWYVSKKYYPQIEPKGMLEKDEIELINLRIKDIFTSKIGNVVIESVDSIVISACLGFIVLGIYQNYFYIVIAVFGFYYLLMESCVAGIGNSIITESADKNYRNFEGLSYISNGICCIIMCCFLNGFQCLIKLWIGSKYLLDYSFVVLFVVFFYLYTMTNYWSVYKNAAGIWHEDRYRPLIGAALNLALNLMFVKKYGLYAIQLSTILSYVIVVIPWLLYNLFKYVLKRDCRDYLLNYTRQILVIVSCCFISWFACSNIGQDSLTDLVFRVALSVTISGLLYFLIFLKTRENTYFIMLCKAILLQIRKR